MHLQTPANSLTLTIVGYQFPDLQPHHNNPYDPNWLMIRITATTPEGTWTITDPSLLASEISELIDWLSSLTQPNTPNPIDPILRFTEPNISFHLSQSAIQNPKSATLEVHLAAESKPPWSPNTPTDTVLSFPLQNLDLTTKIASLKAESSLFPPRTPI